MDLIRTLRYRFRALTRKAHLDREAEEEMRFHLEMLAADYEAKGLSKHEALRRAKIEFGGLERMKENLRNARGTLWIETIMRDITLTIRQLRKSPGFTLTAISIVALGLALATTAASIVDALVFRPIPVENVNELYRVHSGLYSGVMTPPDARDIFEQTEVPAFGYTHRFSVEYSKDNHAGLLTLCELQGDPFTVLSWTAEQGRLLQPNDFLAGSEPTAVLSHTFWKNDLAAPESIIGQSINLNGKSFRIVGILPPESNRVRRTIKPHAWTPLVHTFNNWLYDSRNTHRQDVIARIPSGENLASFQTQLDQVEAYLKNAFPAETGNIDLQAIPETQAARESSKESSQQSYIIAGLVGALLLIACFNVGNMLLANAYRREREFAIRRSVGASPLHITRLLLAESYTIAIVGGIVGVLLSLGLVHLADQLPFTSYVDVLLDRKALFIALAATLVTGLVSGLAPAWHLARGNTADSLKRGSKSTSVTVATKFLVVAQVALSAALLTSSILYLQSLQKALDLDLGFDSSNLSYFSVSLQSVPDYRREQVAKDLRDQVTALPGIQSVVLTRSLPLGGQGGTHIQTDRFIPTQEADKCFSNKDIVSPGLMETLGVTILEGRDFTDAESHWHFKVAMVNEAFQRRFFPEGNCIGQEFWPSGNTGENSARIIGLFKDYSNEPWTEPAPFFIVSQALPRMTMIVRSEGTPLSIRDALSTLIHDPKNEYVAQEISDFSYARGQALSNENSTFYILSLLAASALILSSAGIWYTTRQYVRQNQKELSIRLALGAAPSSLLAFTLNRSLALIALGLALGSILSFVTARWIQKALHGISATDPLPYLVMLGTLLVVATAACYFPARSASKADPKEALSEV